MSLSKGTRPVDEFVLGEFGGKAAEAEPKPEAPVGYHPDRFELLALGHPEEDPRVLAQRRAKQIEQEADAMRAEARADVERAKKQVEEIKRQAYEEGYQQGLEEGQLASRARIEATMSNLDGTVASLERAKANVLGNMERDIVALVQAAVDALFSLPGALPAALLAAVVGAAVDRLPDAERVVVRCAKADLETVREFAPELMDKFSNLQRVDVRADEAMHPGDCMVDAAETVIDATLATRRRAVFAVLEEALRQGPPLDLAALADQQPTREPRPAVGASPGSAEDADGWGDDQPSDAPEAW